MQQLAHKYQVTKPAIAIAWLLRHPAHMQPIVGTTSSQHLKETIKACDFTLTRQEWYDLYLASEKPLPQKVAQATFYILYNKNNIC